MIRMATPQTDNAHGEYEKGTQPVHEQQATYSLFMSLSKWGSLHIAVLITFFVLWLQPGGSIVFGFFAAVALAVIGFFALKSKPAKH